MTHVLDDGLLSVQEAQGSICSRKKETCCCPLSSVFFGDLVPEPSRIVLILELFLPLPSESASGPQPGFPPWSFLLKYKKKRGGGASIRLTWVLASFLRASPLVFFLYFCFVLLTVLKGKRFLCYYKKYSRYCYLLHPSICSNLPREILLR
jgi:hypothetical protein